MVGMRLACLSPMARDYLETRIPDEYGVEVAVLDDRTAATAERLVADADLVLGDHSHEIAIDGDLVAAMGRAQLLHQPSTGYDGIDLDACTAHGIPVTNARGTSAVAMAEYCVLSAMALLRSTVWRHGEVAAGRWPQHEMRAHSLSELKGLTVGLVGLGDAGEAAARRFAPFECTVLYTARWRRPREVEAELGVVWRPDLEALLVEADVVCLLVDLNPGTRHLIDARALELMKATALLVNPARGAIVDERALTAALYDGAIGGAALDVFEHEPPPPDSELLDRHDVLLSPHVGGATREARRGNMRRMFEVIGSVARGEMPNGAVNGITRLRTPEP